MKIKKLGAALAVVAALGAVFASSALAAAVTQDVKWYTGAAPGAELAGSESLAALTSGNSTFTTVVGGNEVTLKSTGIECIECEIENGGGVATGSGKLKFVGVTAEDPPNCTAPAAITTKGLALQADWMHAAGTEPNYFKFLPTLGEEFAFASFELTGAACPVKGAIVPKGSVFFQTTNTTGTQAVQQPAKSSKAIAEGAGGTLHVGAEPAYLTTTTVNFAMSGGKIGVALGTH